jgi:hypothetical protein
VPEVSLESTNLNTWENRQLDIDSDVNVEIDEVSPSIKLYNKLKKSKYKISALTISCAGPTGMEM